MIKKIKQFFTMLHYEKLLKNYNVSNYEFVVDDGKVLVNVNGDVNLSYLELTHIPIAFGHVHGSFYCSHNQLTSLENSPSHCLSLHASSNLIKDLSYCSTADTIYIDNCSQLESLNGLKQVNHLHATHCPKLTHPFNEKAGAIYGSLYLDMEFLIFNSLKKIQLNNLSIILNHHQTTTLHEYLKNHVDGLTITRKNIEEFIDAQEIFLEKQYLEESLGALENIPKKKQKI